jgi:hypothetical protein
MSEVENALTGADVAAPVATPAAPEQPQEPSQESAPANPDEQHDEQARDEKGRFVQKRINELTRQRYEAQRQAEQHRAEAEQLRAEVARYRQPAAPDPNQDLPGYVRHLAHEEARQLLESQQGQARQQQEQQRIQSIAQQYATREAEYAASNPGYTEALDAFVSMTGGNAPELAEVLMTSEHGPAVAHYLGDHLDEAVRILRMPPHLAAAEVARLEARVSAPKPKPVTKAPDPAPKVGGASTAPRGLVDELPISEWMARRQAKL